MGMPGGVGVVDLMMGLPGGDRRWWATTMQALLLDSESLAEFQHAANYMFKELPEHDEGADPVGTLLGEMDRHGIELALIPVSPSDPHSVAAVTHHPDRILGCFMVNPNRGMEGVRALVQAVEELGAVAASFFPCGSVPQVPIDDRKAYPFYAKCVELDIPIFVNAGVPGPRVPMDAQAVIRIDEVCWFFPELRVVLRHGAEPWVDLAIKLMTKWPNLYYSTSAFAPKYYPKQIIDFANSSRGSGRVLYAGYYPSGLSLDRIFAELADLPLHEEIWPKFLRENALDVLKLGARSVSARAS
jgi:predicted TIM-barrel fold metal-dependent hydrolase